MIFEHLLRVALPGTDSLKAETETEVRIKALDLCLLDHRNQTE